MKELFLSKNICVFRDVRPEDELWFRDVDGYKKRLIFISVHVLDTQVKISLFEYRFLTSEKV